MPLRLRLLPFLLTGWLLAVGLSAAGAQATVVRVDRHAYGVSVGPDLAAARSSVGHSSIVTSGGSGSGTSTSTTDTGQLTYHGGPVLHSSAPYLIFWAPNGGQGIPSGEQSLLSRYFTDVAAASGTSGNVYAVGRQYTDATGYAANQQTFSAASQAILDTRAYPAIDTTNCSHTVVGEYTRCLTDSQITAEVKRLVSARGLPTDGPSGAAAMPANAPIYFVVLPADVNVCYPGACADTDFCAYHSYVSSGSNTLLYSVLPTIEFAVGQDPKWCQWDGLSAVQEPNGDPGDVVLKYASHEDNEAITDPLLDAWYDDTTGNENGDNCNYYAASPDPVDGGSPDAFAPTLGGDANAGTLHNQSINGDPYYVQTEWSNGDAACEPGASGAALTSDFATQTSSGAATTFDPSASSAASGVSSATWDFGDGSAEVFRTSAQAMATVSHSYAAAGAYTATLTLVDGSGDVATVSHSVVVGPPAPTASVVTAGPGTGQPTSFAASPGWTDYAWTFGDGTSTEAATATASHVYTAPGTYIVGLAVSDASGHAATTSTTVTVAGPTPLIAATPGPAGSVSVFAATGSGDTGGGGLTGYAWDFGDGARATTASAQHVYAAAGTYTVTLTLTDARGFAASAQGVVTVGAPPAPPPPGGSTTTGAPVTTAPAQTAPPQATTPSQTAAPPPAAPKPTLPARSTPVTGHTASLTPGVTVTAGHAARAWRPGQRVTVRAAGRTVHLTAAQLRRLARHGLVRLAVRVGGARQRARARTLVVRVRTRHGRRYVSAALAG